MANSFKKGFLKLHNNSRNRENSWNNNFWNFSLNKFLLTAIILLQIYLNQSSSNKDE